MKSVRCFFRCLKTLTTVQIGYTSSAGFPGGKRPFGPPASGFENIFSMRWVAARAVLLWAPWRRRRRSRRTRRRTDAERGGEEEREETGGGDESGLAMAPYLRAALSTGNLKQTLEIMVWVGLPVDS